MSLHWIKPFTWGAAVGAVAWWIVLSFAFGWTSASTAQKRADRQSEQAVIAALAPLCAANFMSQADAAAKKAALANASSWDRRNLFPKAWVTLPGERYPDTDLIAACSKIVLEGSPKTGAAS